MVALIKVNLYKIIYKVPECIIGVMAGHTMANGRIIRWKAEAFSHGQMAEDMKASTSTIKRRATASLYGLMEGSMLAAGKMANSTE